MLKKGNHIIALEKHSSEEEIVEYIIATTSDPARRMTIVALLKESNPIYREKGSNQVNRIRGFILSRFEAMQTPDSLLPYIAEILENSQNSFLIGAAAKAVRGLRTPNVQLVPYLLKGIENIRLHDDLISFDSYRPTWPVENPTTGLKEILHSLRWMGTYACPALDQLNNFAREEQYFFTESIKSEILSTIEYIRTDERQIEDSCCSLEISGLKTMHDEIRKEQIVNIKKARMEDQFGRRISYGKFFRGKPAILAFMYTRCDNPNKCSLTVTRLGQLQMMMKEEGIGEDIKIAIVTYDPGHDCSVKLRAYAENRGFKFDENNRAFRVEEQDFPGVRKHFELGVNYIGSIVNQHAIELFVLDKNGNISKAYSRLQWNNKEVIDQITPLLKGKERKILIPNLWVASARLGKNIWSVIPPIIIAFFPKCPMCWAAYLSVLGISGLNTIPYSPWLLPVFMVIMSINLFVLYRGASKRNGMLPFYLSLIGAIILMVPGFLLKLEAGYYAGILLIFGGSLLNSLSFRFYLRLKLTWSHLFR